MTHQGCRAFVVVLLPLLLLPSLTAEATYTFGFASQSFEGDGVGTETEDSLQHHSWGQTGWDLTGLPVVGFPGDAAEETLQGGGPSSDAVPPLEQKGEAGDLLQNQVEILQQRRNTLQQQHDELTRVKRDLLQRRQGVQEDGKAFIQQVNLLELSNLGKQLELEEQQLLLEQKRQQLERYREVLELSKAPRPRVRGVKTLLLALYVAGLMTIRKPQKDAEPYAAVLLLLMIAAARLVSSALEIRRHTNARGSIMQGEDVAAHHSKDGKKKIGLLILGTVSIMAFFSIVLLPIFFVYNGILFWFLVCSSAVAATLVVPILLLGFL